MLEVSQIQIAAMMLTLVGVVDAGPYVIDSFNDRTDGQFRRRSNMEVLGRFRKAQLTLFPMTFSRWPS